MNLREVDARVKRATVGIVLFVLYGVVIVDWSLSSALLFSLAWWSIYCLWTLYRDPWSSEAPSIDNL